VSSRIDIPLRPSAWVGFLATTPWLVLSVFNLVLAYAYSAFFLILAAMALAGALYQWNLNGRLCLNRSIVRLTVTENGLQTQQRNGEQYPVTPHSGSRLYPRLIILKLEPTDATHTSSTVLLWAGQQGSGNVPGNPHRQLRAWLRLGSGGDRPEQSH